MSASQPPEPPPTRRKSSGSPRASGLRPPPIAPVRRSSSRFSEASHTSADSPSAAMQSPGMRRTSRKSSQFADARRSLFQQFSDGSSASSTGNGGSGGSGSGGGSGGGGGGNGSGGSTATAGSTPRRRASSQFADAVKGLQQSREAGTSRTASELAATRSTRDLTASEKARIKSLRDEWKVGKRSETKHVPHPSRELSVAEKERVAATRGSWAKAGPWQRIFRPSESANSLSLTKEEQRRIAELRSTWQRLSEEERSRAVVDFQQMYATGRGTRDGLRSRSGSAVSEDGPVGGAGSRAPSSPSPPALPPKKRSPKRRHTDSDRLLAAADAGDDPRHSPATDALIPPSDTAPPPPDLDANSNSSSGSTEPCLTPSPRRPAFVTQGGALEGGGNATSATSPSTSTSTDAAAPDRVDDDGGDDGDLKTSKPPKKCCVVQ